MRDINIMEKIKLDTVQQVIAVVSGKGGVGKSTVALNLALALQALGKKVGILDADIYGPSQALMLGCQKIRAESDDGKTVKPVMKYGIASMSIAYLMPDEKQPAIWRGPMVSGAFQQLLKETQWGELDYLIIDLPPGTGDIHLTMIQKINLTGAVIVTTPQDVALIDARKAIEMLLKVKVPILGIVENMSVYHCEHCGHESSIFGKKGGESLAKSYEVNLLGRIPLSPSLCENMDRGHPPVVSQEDSPDAFCFLDIAKKIEIILAEGVMKEKSPSLFPELEIDD